MGVNVMYNAIGALVFLLGYFAIAGLIVAILRVVIPENLQGRILERLGLVSDHEYED